MGNKQPAAKNGMSLGFIQLYIKMFSILIIKRLCV